MTYGKEMMLRSVLAIAVGAVAGVADADVVPAKNEDRAGPVKVGNRDFDRNARLDVRRLIWNPYDPRKEKANENERRN